ncbi:MAG: hypothetical protein K0S47_133 [Herbinix sp.]|jgi:cytochrome c-type biogenesis protein|nr:hypothetical protein [Herbinix sp.]
MLEGLVSTNSISFILVFLEGLLSFFSPCVIPLIPIYMSYLAGSAKSVSEDGTIKYQRKKVFLHTIFFVFGISSAFFLLGYSITSLGSFFQENQLLFTRVGGILIIGLGLIQTGFLEIKFLQRERKFHLSLGDREMNPLLAFLMGFTFSFAWTPCVGPALSSVIILAANAQNTALSNLLILLYSAGFVIPFLLLGLFTTQVLNFLKAHQKLLKYTVKIGGVILIIIGIMTFTGWMNGISKYLNTYQPPEINSGSNVSENDSSQTNENSGEINLTPNTSSDDTAATPSPAEDTSDQGKKAPIPAFDFTLVDQYGNEHTLSDYKGKIVFLNFWATWCPPCREEMPDIEALYNEFNQNQDDVIILGVANPSSDEYPQNQDEDKDTIIKFLEDNDYTFPVVFDETGELLESYYIRSFPTTFMIDMEGNIFGYAPSMLTKDMMLNAIEQTRKSTE